MGSSIIPERRVRRAGTAGACAILLASVPAGAQPAQSDPVAATALFKAAKALVDAGNWAAGCAKFQASLDAQASASTMIHIALCHEHDGKIATAWDDYNRALALNVETRGADRRRGLEDLAKKGAAALQLRLPQLRVVVKSPPAGLKVTRDGKEVPVAALGDPLPGDPGPHEIVASAPGYKTETRSVTLAEAKTETVEITLAVDPNAGAAAAPPEKKAPGVPVWAWVAGAGGLVLTGVGAYFLADDLSAIRALRSSSNCRPLSDLPGYSCAPGYDFAADNSRKDRDLPLAIALGGVGIAAIGAAIGGIVWGLTAKPADAPRTGVTVGPWAAPGGAGLTLGGSF